MDNAFVLLMRHLAHISIFVSIETECRTGNLDVMRLLL